MSSAKGAMWIDPFAAGGAGAPQGAGSESIEGESVSEPFTARWLQLARLYEINQQVEDAITCYRQLAAIYRDRRQYDEAEVCLLELERLGCEERGAIHRAYAELYAETLRFDAAERSCRLAVAAFLEEGRVGEAVRFVRALPSVGERSEQLASELQERVTAAVGDAIAARRDGSRLPARNRRKSDDPAILLSGRLDHVALFDVLQIAQNGSITGLFEVGCGSISGRIFFETGRIVAARFGLLAGREALKHILELRTGAFQLLSCDAVPSDEFGAAHNTALLMDLVCEIDEEGAHAA